MAAPPSPNNGSISTLEAIGRTLEASRGNSRALGPAIASRSAVLAGEGVAEEAALGAGVGVVVVGDLAHVVVDVVVAVEEARPHDGEAGVELGLHVVRRPVVVVLPHDHGRR